MCRLSEQNVQYTWFLPQTRPARKEMNVEVNPLKFRFIKSLRHTAILNSLNFCANSAKSKT